jgi:putative Flp pilus-assembly TadE/G-like protein
VTGRFEAEEAAKAEQATGAREPAVFPLLTADHLLALPGPVPSLHGLRDVAPRAGRLRRRLSPSGDERGAVLVTVVLWLPVLVGMATLVIDVASWFMHKRHLQMQADAAALAAARDWVQPGCDDARIRTRAEEYGGAVWNAQIGGTPPEKVHMVLNSRTYYNQSSPVDGTVDTRPPCESAMVDVKLTETDLPWFLKAAQVVPFINAHARVSVVQADSVAGALPVGVPDSRPQRARVTFIDEATGEVLAQRELLRMGQSGGLATWDNSADPVPVTIDRSRIGVRVALSGGSSLNCGDPLVDCYDLGSANGVSFMRGWSSDGSVAPDDNPLPRDVRLLSGTCTGAYFTSASSACAIGVETVVDFGAADPATDLGARLLANVGGRTDYPLTYDPATGRWRSDAVIPIAPQAGPVNLDLKWEKTTGSSAGATCNNRGNNPCQGTFPGVQRTFSATEPRSGPIEEMQIYDAAAPLDDANSFEMCGPSQASCTHDLVVALTLVGSLEDAASISDPPVALRVVGGSQNQSLDCDPDKSNLKDEIATGCGPSYARNTGTACPDGNSELWGGPQPWHCVGVQTGTAVNQVAAGMNLRVLGDEQPDTCTDPNDWSSFPNISPGDPRIVQVFLTPFGSFSGSGNTTFPVTGFATFYVTGWSAQGSGFANPCEGLGDDPVPNGEGGYIMGHFIKYIPSIDASGSEACQQDVFGTCVAVMTE